MGTKVEGGRGKALEAGPLKNNFFAASLNFNTVYILYVQDILFNFIVYSLYKN